MNTKALNLNFIQFSQTKRAIEKKKYLTKILLATDWLTFAAKKQFGFNFKCTPFNNQIF